MTKTPFHYKELQRFLVFLQKIIQGYAVNKNVFDRELNFLFNRMDDIILILTHVDSADENLIEFKLTKDQYIHAFSKFIVGMENKIKE